MFPKARDLDDLALVLPLESDGVLVVFGQPVVCGYTLNSGSGSEGFQVRMMNGIVRQTIRSMARTVQPSVPKTGRVLPPRLRTSGSCSGV